MRTACQRSLKNRHARNVGYYERFGFRLVLEGDVPYGPVPIALRLAPLRTAATAFPRRFFTGRLLAAPREVRTVTLAGLVPR
jgi:hypothetical protein